MPTINHDDLALMPLVEPSTTSLHSSVRGDSTCVFYDIQQHTGKSVFGVVVGRGIVQDILFTRLLWVALSPLFHGKWCGNPSLRHKLLSFLGW